MFSSQVTHFSGNLSAWFRLDAAVTAGQVMLIDPGHVAQPENSLHRSTAFDARAWAMPPIIRGCMAANLRYGRRLAMRRC
jgi:hypothetical protein